MIFILFGVTYNFNAKLSVRLLLYFVFFFFSFSEKLTFRDIVSPQEFRQGEDAEVVCRVTSSPAPIVSWLYRNEEVTTIADS